MSASDHKLWVILGAEENPLGLAWAETAGGAKKKYEKNMGVVRDGVHVSVVSFCKGYYSFICSI